MFVLSSNNVDSALGTWAKDSLLFQDQQQQQQKGININYNSKG